MSKMRVSKISARWRIVIFAAFLATVVAIGLLVPLPSVEEIRAVADAGGIWVPIVFAIVYAFATLTPIPSSVMSIAAGLVWGLGVGFLAVYVGALGGAMIAFTASRVLGRESIERITGARVAAVDDLLRSRGMATVIGMRLVPLFPFAVLNYTAGLTSVRRRDYALGTMIGIVPGTLAYVAVGAYGFSLEWPFFIAMAFLGILTIGGAVLAVRIRSRSRATAANIDSETSADSPTATGSAE